MPKGSFSLTGALNVLQAQAEGKALEQMYYQSRFEAQCWFYTSLIISIIGTTFVLSTILLFLLFQDELLMSDSGKVALVIANIVTGIVQHLIISQARTANKRADYYAKELRREANELNIYEILKLINAALPEGEERNSLIVQTIMDALLHAHEQNFATSAVPPQQLFRL